MKKQKIYLFFLLFGLIFVGFSCNSSDDNYNEYVASQSVQVSGFRLASNDSVLANLDSVFFSIDLDRGLIYNADSLPVGTNVSALIANINFGGTMSEVKIFMDRGSAEKNDTIDYLESQTDSIDFTSKVTMKVVGENTAAVKYYSLKVNVHTVVPDSMYWSELLSNKLPGAGRLIAQKTVSSNGFIYCLVQRENGYILATGDSPLSFEERSVTFPFTPDIKSLQVAGNTLYMLSETGELFVSTDGNNWAATGTEFYSLQGVWNEFLVGVINDNGVYKHDLYPRNSFVPVKVENDFPVTGSSNMVTYRNEWSGNASQSIMVGGRMADGNLTGATWGFDGKSWAKFNNDNAVTPREGAILFPYFTFYVNNAWITTKETTWFLIGGRTNTGVSKEVSLSSSSGIVWRSASSLLSMPSSFLPRYDASVVIVNEMNSAAMPSSWKKMDVPAIPRNMARVKSVTEWEVPYVYMLGGTGISGDVYDQVYRGVINRLTFVPIP